jgi:hypothetical protein
MFLKGVIRVFAESIPTRILAALLSIYAVTYAATAIVVYSSARQSILEADTGSLSRLADAKYEQLANRIEALATDLTAWSELEIMNDLASGDIDKRVTQALETLRRLYDLPGDIHAFDSAGKLLATSGGAPVGQVPSAIPPQWQSGKQRLDFVDKHRDPTTGAEIVALTIPVFGTFDSKYRIGTLVLTFPWSAVERLLFGTGNGTTLLEKGAPVRVLAASPPELVEKEGLQRIAGGAESDEFVVGRSAERSGLLAHWQVLMLQDVASATRPLQRVAMELVLLGVALGIPIALPAAGCHAD